MQFSKIRFGITALALGTLGSLFGCSKEDTQDVTPRASAAATTTAVRSVSETAAQLDWQRFTADVDAGKLADPFGQYVSKDTRVASNGQVRPVRPKRDGKLRPAKTGSSTDIARYPQIEEPCEGCGGGGYYPPPYTFVTSEGQGLASAYPGGYILDLKLVTNSSSSWLYPDHIRLNADLNKGAGGDYIYLTFTRAGSYGASPLTRLSVLTRTWGQPGSWPDQHQPIWYGQYNASGGNVSTYDSQLDLNSGAGGDYIFAYQARESSFGAPIREVGVISSGNSGVQPPAGWERVGVDLNKGAGGDYIYLCVKR